MHKVLIIILFISILISLTSGFSFLLRDTDKPGSKRTLYALGTRLGLAATLILVIIHGVYSGKIGHDAPWDKVPSHNQISK